MKRWILGMGLAIILLIPCKSAQAQYYHSSGISLFGAPLVGVYKYPAGGGYGGAGYSPGYGYSPYGYAPGPMMSPGGCQGSGAGYSYGLPGASYGYGAPSPSYGYGAPQAGFISSIGGVLEAIRAFKAIRDEFEQIRTGPDTATKDELKKLSDKLTALESKVDALKLTPNVTDRLDKIDQQLNTLVNVDLKKIDARLKKIEEGKDGK
jgi:hypothetical protein